MKLSVSMVEFEMEAISAYISPTTVTGHLTGCTLLSLKKMSRARSQRFLRSPSGNGLQSSSIVMYLSRSFTDTLCDEETAGSTIQKISANK